MGHPALQEARAATARLAEAAAKVGAPNPHDAIAHMECDPQRIEAYGRELDKSVAELDNAIREAEHALAEHGDSADGESADAAREEAEAELAELKKRRDELQSLADKVRKLAGDLDAEVRAAAGRIADIAAGAEPAVQKVLDKSVWDELLDDGDAEDAINQINQAVREIIKVAQDFQARLSELRAEFQELKSAGGGDAERGDGGGGSGGGGGGGADGGGAGGGDAERGDGGGDAERGGGSSGGGGASGD